MATVDLVMPKMGEIIMEATILKWHKKAGDPIKMDETLLEIATDKVDSEVPSTTEGVVEELLFDVNDVVPIGKVIARIRTGGESQSSQDDQANHAARHAVHGGAHGRICGLCVLDSPYRQVMALPRARSRFQRGMQRRGPAAHMVAVPGLSS